ncbi:MAG: helix-turn-helix domain-containing protein [Parafannyhessea sp.]|uniref:helix-turn-helix domain-containing protein n=1 Tax=Parafannyhessea sp. TaxID=2847324 RepID=UPI003F09ED60
MPSADPGATGAAGAADHEPLTEELLARLLASATPQEYLDQTQVGERDFAAYLRSLLQQKGLTRADVLRACDVSPSFGYQVFQGTRRPSRDTAIALAFGLGCSLREVQRLLRRAGHSELYCKVRRDAVIIFCLEHGYTQFECDDELFRLGEKTIGADGAGAVE